MHDGMPHDPIQGQGQGHGGLWSSENFTFHSSATYSETWQM